MVMDREIKNNITGQVIRFIKTGKETNGEFLEIEAVYEAYGLEPPEHYHPEQKEVFEIISGELSVRINSVLKTYTKGDVLHIKPGVKHSMWNGHVNNAIVNWKIYPALNTEEFLTTMTLLANKGLTNDKGVPKLPLMIYLLNKYKASIRLSKISLGVIGSLFFLLKPIFYLFNYKQKYKLTNINL